MKQAIVYTRHGCHLCDEAVALLKRFDIGVTTIDIDASPELLNEYNQCVPVVQINGKIRFRGRVNEILLRRLLADSPS